jgi:ribonuclease HI
MLSVKIISRSDQKSLLTTPLISEITSTLSHLTAGQKIIAYTDGSTSPRGKSPNSGSGIFITDSNHKVVWSGGLIVRSDGNNFIAEMAAAAIVTKAFPPHLRLVLRIDSMATIGAITKGLVSERNRIRAAGRAWMNMCRSDFLRKQGKIKVEHISSHKGTQTPEQIGNDAADRLANNFRLLGEASQPAPYLLETEESLLFFHNNLLMQGDPRDFLKSLEKQAMIDTWKTKAPKQASWFLKHPTQVLKQAKQAWKWSVERGTGEAWLYFVFGICQWLPTNHRLNKGKDETLRRCTLCLCNIPEKMDHLLKCPALANS